MLEHPGEIAHVVAGKPQLGSGAHGSRERVERRPRDEAALVVAEFGPGVGEEDEDAAQACRRKCRDQEPRVVDEEAHIVEPATLDFGEEPSDAVLEDLGADEGVLGMGRRLRREVLARAEADLEPELGEGTGEERFGIERFALGQREAQ